MSYAVEPLVYSVQQCNELVNELLSEEIGTILVEGEISNFQVKRNQWVTFDLKDSGSVVNCFASLFKVGRSFDHGMHVRILAKPRIYVPYGKYSLTVEAVQPIGAGALQQAYELLLRQLTAEGLFDPQHKQAIPTYPERIGIITSAEGAAIDDVRKVLTERWGGFQLALYPVHVQGKEAATDVLRAIHYCNEHSTNDVLIVTRGGGSLEDLQAFNDERVARAIFSSRIPIICAIGHEKDTSIAELVADQRAATPSHAAQLAVPDRATVQAYLHQLSSQTQQRVQTRIHRYQSRLATERQLIARSVQRVLQAATHQLTRYELAAQQIPKRAARATSTLLQEERRLTHRAQQLLGQSQQRLMTAAGIAQALDPRAVLRRGYSFTTDQELGTVIRTIGDVVPGQQLTTHLADGIIQSEVTHAN